MANDRNQCGCPLELSSTTEASGFLAGVSSEHQSAVQATIRENPETGPRMGKVLRQVAWGAARTKRRYLRIKCHRLAAYRGKKRALAAVAHNTLVIGWVGILGCTLSDRTAPMRTVAAFEWVQRRGRVSGRTRGSRPMPVHCDAVVQREERIIWINEVDILRREQTMLHEDCWRNRSSIKHFQC